MTKLDLTGKVLVVVDMEPGYSADMSEAQLKAVESLIRKAVRAESLVVFLEFLDSGTLSRLLRHVRCYDMFVREQKESADGSDEVLAACERGNYDIDAFVVCGVETNCCVARTAAGLAEQCPNASVEVVRVACGSREGSRWSEFPVAANIKLVG